MKNYEIKTISKLDADGNIYWTALFPKIDGVVGGGDTEAEAITEAQENLKIYGKGRIYNDTKRIF